MSKYTEFKLKLSRSTVTDHQHHVMILNSTSISLSDLTVPLRLNRQKESASISNSSQENDDLEVDGEQQDDRPRNNRRKTRIINVERKLAQEEEIELESREISPWVLEDADAQHTFLGRLEGGQQSNYVFFVNQGKDFLVVPTSRWYRFNPKPAYRPLTTEEAEAQMAARGRNRALLTQQLQHTRQRDAALGRQSASIESLNFEDADMPTSSSMTNSQSRLKALRESMVSEAQVAASVGQYGKKYSPSEQPLDELDYDEVFDDDDQGEELVGVDEDDPSAPKPVILKKSNHKLSAAGREMGKLVRNFDRKIVDYRISDEERDPYADADDYNSDEEELSDSSSTKSSTPNVGKLPPHLAAAIPRHSSLPTLQATQIPPIKANSSASSPEKRKASSILQKNLKPSQPVASSNLIPEVSNITVVNSTASTQLIIRDDIVSLLRKGPLRTKDLIASLRDKLKDPANKELFKDIIKKVAIVRTGTNDEEKWLELKGEFA